MALLRPDVMLLAVCWFAMTPAGIVTRIAMEKPRAMITSKARIFLLEMFRIALFITPIVKTLQFYLRRAIEEENEGVFFLGSYSGLWPYDYPFPSRLPCRVIRARVIKEFFKISPKSNQNRLKQKSDKNSSHPLPN